MGIWKLGLKIFSTHAIMSVVQLALMPALFGLWEDNQIYQWIIGLFYIAVFWLIVYADVSSISQNDLKRDKYTPVKGFVGGLLASIPVLVLFVVAVVYEPSAPPGQQGIDFFEMALRIWLVPYVKVFNSFENLMPSLALAPILVFPLVCGLSYLDGPRRRKKILEAIEKSDAMRAEKSRIHKN